MLGGGGEKAAAPEGKAGQQLPAVTRDRARPPGRSGDHLRDRLARRAARHAGRRRPARAARSSACWSSPASGSRAGQTLAVIDRSVQAQEAAQLAAQIEVARADLRLAQNELDRAQALVARGFVSQADLDRKRATRDAAAARVRVAQADSRRDPRPHRPARRPRADRRPRPRAATSRRARWSAPARGALFRIAAGGEMELLARLPQTDLARLSAGVPVTVTPVGSDRNPIRAASGRSRRSSIRRPARAWPASRSPINRDLRPGGFAAAEIRAGSTTAPLLPESAVLTDDAGTYVMIVGPNNTVQRRAVRIGSVTDRGVVVAQGLNGNERVVESAGAFLNPGERIRPERSRAPRR